MTVEATQFEYAQSAHLAGRLDEAEALYHQILSDQPGNSECLHLLGLLHAATSRRATAIQLVGAAIQLEGPQPHLCKNLALLFEQGGEWSNAIACWKQYFESAEFEAATAAHFARLLAASSRYSEAEAQWQRICAAAPNQPSHLLEWANCLALGGENSAAAVLYEQVLYLEPDCVEAHFHLGIARMHLNLPETAILHFEDALRRDPRHARAHNNLAILLHITGETGAAVAHYREALRCDPGYLEACYNLATAYQESGKAAYAVTVFRKVLRKNPGYPAAWTNLGNSWLALNRIDEAEFCFLETLRQAPHETAAKWNLGLLQLVTGNLDAGWRGYELRFDVPGATPRREFQAPLWQGEPLEGQSILIHAEQGLGDTLQFIRYAPLLAESGAHVVFECQPPLLPLLEGIEGIAVIVPARPPAPGSLAPAPTDHLPRTDYQLPLLSLPAVFATQCDNIPWRGAYVHASRDRAGDWRMSPPEGVLNVGIVWAGNPKHKNDRNRSLPAALLSQLHSIPGVQFVSLQKDKPPPESLPMLDISGELHNFAETAAAIANLDLVISVDTAVAHLAGAMGKPCWVLLPFAPDWRWMLDRTDTPWYPSARLFRQSAPGGWNGILKAVRTELQELAKRKQ